MKSTRQKFERQKDCDARIARNVRITPQAKDVYVGKRQVPDGIRHQTRTCPQPGGYSCGDTSY